MTFRLLIDQNALIELRHYPVNQPAPYRGSSWLRPCCHLPAEQLRDLPTRKSVHPGFVLLVWPILKLLWGHRHEGATPKAVAAQYCREDRQSELGEGKWKLRRRAHAS